MTLPVFQAAGTFQGSSGALTVPWPAHQLNDVALLFVESENQAITLSSAQGFVEITQLGTGAAGGPNSTRLALFWCRASSGSMNAPVVADSGDHQTAQILTFRGCTTTGNPWEALTSDVQAGSDATVEIPGGTTVTPDCLVVAASSASLNQTVPRFSGWTNAALSDVTERADMFTAYNNGGGFGVATGGKATAGAIGTTTAALASGNSTQARISLALKPTVVVSAMPVFQTAGTPVSGTGAVSPAWPAHLENDVAILVVTSANEAISLSTPAGFVEVTGSPLSTGTGGANDAIRLAVFWCRATGSAMGAPTVADPGSHATAQIFTFRGCDTSGNPWDVIGSDVLAAASATVTIPGATTTVPNCLILAISADSRDVASSSQFTGWANADLSSVTEVADFHTNLGNGSGFGAAVGGKASAGAYGVTTATLTGATDAVQARMSIALRPPGGAPAPVGDVSLPHRYWRMVKKNAAAAGPAVNEVELVERVGPVAAGGSIIRTPAKLHPGVTHFRPMFAVNQGGDASAVFDIDVALVTLPAGYSPDIPTDQVTRTVETFVDDDGVLRPGVGQSDGAGSLPLVKGVVRGTGRHGDDVTFSEFGRVFQAVPEIVIDGGINHQPASKWGTAAAVDAGTAATAPSSSIPQYKDFSARDLTESGFTISARLRQKATITARSINFPAGDLDAVGENSIITTITNAPAADDRYTVRFSAQASIRSTDGNLYQIIFTLGVETSINSGATWQSRGTAVIKGQTTATLVPVFIGGTGSVTFLVPGLTNDGTDRIRLTLLGIQTIGLGVYSQAKAVPGSADFNTSTGDSYANATPDADDIVTWKATGYV